VVGDQMALQTTTSVRPHVADREGELHCGRYLHSQQWVIFQLGVWRKIEELTIKYRHVAKYYTWPLTGEVSLQ